MRSKITVEIDFDNGQPYFRVLEDRFSDDVRDKLVTHFRQKLGHTSSWAMIEFGSPVGEGNVTDILRWIIRPITPEQLREEANTMLAIADSMPEKIPE